MKEKNEAVQELRTLPQVDKVLRHPLVSPLLLTVRRDLLSELTRQNLERCRAAARDGVAVPALDAIAQAVVHEVEELMRGGVRRVLNGTGVILNTNLGRAPLSGAILARLEEVLPGYCSLEIELESGRRGERGRLSERLLRLLTGCEAAIVVNNNAAAVMLAVTALSQQREVIVSRGELIEIGGSFRLPDVVTASGGILREVGTTNRTRAADYRKAINENSGILLRCHRSNFEIRGFTEQPRVGELAQIATEAGLPLVEDLGSGAIIDLARLGLKDEPTVAQVLQEGADLVLFSADKLLGGVQAGIVAGKRALVERMRKHPIYRALRPDKIIMSVLEVALAQFLAPAPEETVPVLKMASATAASIEWRAQSFVAKLNGQLSTLKLVVVPVSSALGGGTAPGETLASFGIQVTSEGDLSADKLARHLRLATAPVMTVVVDGDVVIDLRTISEAEEALLASSLGSVDRQIRQIKRI